MNKLFYLFLMLISHPVLGQVVASPKETSFIYDIVGRKGVLLAVGILFFAYSYKNSVKLFAWIEDQTFGTRDFILQKCDLLYIDIKPNHVTYGLLILSFGIPTVIMGIFFV